MSSFKVAAAQIVCRPGDIRANLEIHLSAIEEAHAAGVDLLVFPELSLSDYVSVPDLPKVGRTLDSPEFGRLIEAAGDMLVAVGFVETNEGPCYSIAHAILGRGCVQHVHRKVNLATYGALQEGLHYTPGREINPVVVREGWQAATLVCADAWNPAIPWLALLKGATLLLMPVASAREAVGNGFDNPWGWALTLRQIALTYGVPVVMTNHCGARGGLSFWGGSCIIDAFGHTLAEIGDEPGLITATLDPADGIAARRRLPTVRDAYPGLIHKQLTTFLAGADGYYEGAPIVMPDPSPGPIPIVTSPAMTGEPMSAIDDDAEIWNTPFPIPDDTTGS